MDNCCNTGNFMAVGISWWLCGWWTHSSRAGRCHHRRGDPSYSGTTGVIAIWIVAGEGEAFRNEGASRPRKILPKLAILSGEKVSQPTISPQTYREE